MVGLVGVEVRVQVIARAGSERRSTSKVTSAAPEMFKRESHESQAPRVKPCSRESDLRPARCFSTVQLAPPHGWLVESDCPYGAEPRPCPGLLGWNFTFCDISPLLGKINFIDLYTCIIMQGIKI